MSIAQGKVVRDGRQLGFFVVTKDATKAMRSAFSGRSLATARSIYFEIVEEANTASSDTLTAARARIAERAGVHVSTVTEYADRLASIGLLAVERRVVDGVNLPNIWTLTTPPAPPPGVLASDEDPSSQTSTLLVSGEEGSSSQASPREERIGRTEEAAAAGAREVAVIPSPPPLPAGVAAAVDVLDRNGMTVMDTGLLVRMEVEHPGVDLRQAALNMVRWAQQGGRTIARPAQALRRFVDAPDAPKLNGRLPGETEMERLNREDTGDEWLTPEQMAALEADPASTGGSPW